MTGVQCPKCAAAPSPAYAGRHAAEHARLERNHAESVAADAAVTARFGPVTR